MDSVPVTSADTGVYEGFEGEVGVTLKAEVANDDVSDNGVIDEESLAILERIAAISECNDIDGTEVIEWLEDHSVGLSELDKELLIYFAENQAKEISIQRIMVDLLFSSNERQDVEGSVRKLVTCLDNLSIAPWAFKETDDGVIFSFRRADTVEDLARDAKAKFLERALDSVRNVKLTELIKLALKMMSEDWGRPVTSRDIRDNSVDFDLNDWNPLAIHLEKLSVWTDYPVYKMIYSRAAKGRKSNIKVVLNNDVLTRQMTSSDEQEPLAAPEQIDEQFDQWVSKFAYGPRITFLRTSGLDYVFEDKDKEQKTLRDVLVFLGRNLNKAIHIDQIHQGVAGDYFVRRATELDMVEQELARLEKGEKEPLDRQDNPSFLNLAQYCSAIRRQQIYFLKQQQKDIEDELDADEIVDKDDLKKTLQKLEDIWSHSKFDGDPFRVVGLGDGLFKMMYVSPPRHGIINSWATMVPPREDTTDDLLAHPDVRIGAQGITPTIDEVRQQFEAEARIGGTSSIMDGLVNAHIAYPEKDNWGDRPLAWVNRSWGENAFGIPSWERTAMTRLAENLGREVGIKTIVDALSVVARRQSAAKPLPQSKYVAELMQDLMVSKVIERSPFQLVAVPGRQAWMLIKK